MTSKPYFMNDKKWYYTNEDGEYILTKDAPQEAVDDYNKRKAEYIKKMSNGDIDDILNISEDSDWLIFPID